MTSVRSVAAWSRRRREVELECDLDALGERIPLLPRLKRPGEQRCEGGIEGTQRGEVMALKVEGEGLED
jgi:hypothetical protein